MQIESKLKGLRLESVTLGKGATSFELDGTRNGEHCRYFLTTGFEICFNKEDIFKRDIRDDSSTMNLWKILEHNLSRIHVSEDERVCELQFEGAFSVFVWSKEVDHDNLIIVRKYSSDEWFTIA